MDFFTRQELAHRNTRLALALFVGAVVAIVAAVNGATALVLYSLQRYDGALHAPDGSWYWQHWDIVLWVTFVTLAVIAIGALAEIAQLRKGGGVVATRLGGRRVPFDSDDLAERRLVNVVNEMAIASGAPVPEVYVLDNEPAINAFAAGMTLDDAAIGVTRGAVDKLSRAELQGVIAHEFSHILHGDMRLNLRLSGVLQGILLLAIVGKRILFGWHWGGYSRRRWYSSRSNNRRGGGAEGVVVVAGVALLLIGYVGLFFARLIQALVSRQREYLADAAAVQFTRYPEGLAGALKKIGGLDDGSALHSAEAERVSHLLFGAQRKPWTAWMATHPPLVARVKALDPRFTPDDFAAVAAAPVGEPADLEGVAAFAGAVPARVNIDPRAVIDRVGHPEAVHLAYAARLLESLDDDLRAALDDPKRAGHVVLAAALGEARDNRAAQVALLKDGFDRADVASIAGCWRQIGALGPAARLPVVDLACVALKRRPATELQALVADLERLIYADEALDLAELALLAVVRAHLRDALAPKRQRPRRLALIDAREDVRLLLASVARAGNPELDAAQLAFEVGATDLFGSQGLKWPPKPVPARAVLKVLDRLDGLGPAHKRGLVAALVATAGHDGSVTVAESELLRAICETMHVPLPPLAAAGFA